MDKHGFSNLIPPCITCEKVPEEVVCDGTYRLDDPSLQKTFVCWCCNELAGSSCEICDKRLECDELYEDLFSYCFSCEKIHDAVCNDCAEAFRAKACRSGVSGSSANAESGSKQCRLMHPDVIDEMDFDEDQGRRYNEKNWRSRPGMEAPSALEIDGSFLSFPVKVFQPHEGITPMMAIKIWESWHKTISDYHLPIYDPVAFSTALKFIMDAYIQVRLTYPTIVLRHHRYWQIGV